MFDAALRIAGEEPVQWKHYGEHMKLIRENFRVLAESHNDLLEIMKQMEQKISCLENEVEQLKTHVEIGF